MFDLANQVKGSPRSKGYSAIDAFDKMSQAIVVANYSSNGKLYSLPKTLVLADNYSLIKSSYPHEPTN